MRTVGLACLAVVLLLVCGCGNVFVRGSWGSGNQTVSGTVSVVRLTIIVDSNNVSTQVTIVTFLNQSSSSDVSFCGDQRSQFPLQQFAQATFTSGQMCDTLLQVSIKL